MNAPKRLVLDANIPLRGVFGVRVLNLLEAYEDAVAFYSPNVFGEDARYIPDLAERRRFDPAAGLLVLDHLARIVEPLTLVSTGFTKNAPEPAFPHVILRTGQSLTLPCFSIVRSGLRIGTSSAAAWRHGPRTGLNYTSVTPKVHLATRVTNRPHDKREPQDLWTSQT